MKLPLQITFRHMEKSEAAEANIREHCDKLEQFHDNIMSCQVVVDQQSRHKYKGNLYAINLFITVPGEDIAVANTRDGNHAHEDIYVAIRDAFTAARRQLETRVELMKRKVKNHEPPPHGRISELHPERDFGRIDTADGRDIYFHANSVTNGDFEKLEIGNEVRFVEEMGDKGPQASSVHVIGKHHIVG